MIYERAREKFVAWTDKAYDVTSSSQSQFYLFFDEEEKTKQQQQKKKHINSAAHYYSITMASLSFSSLRKSTSEVFLTYKSQLF